MVPATLVFPCLAWWSKAWTDWQWGDWSLIPLGLVIVLSVAAVINGWAYVAQHWSDVYANIRTVQNSTPEVRMFEAARGMHPDAVKALLVHRRTVWRVKYIPLKDTVDWILDEAPNVHAGFVDFVLDNSNGALMPKHGRLSEGSTKFDPDGLVTDYEQYDDLLSLMQSKLMCTAAYGNQSAKLIPPWTVELLRRRFGLDGEGYQVDDGMSEAMRKMIESQQVAPLSSSTTTSPQMPLRGHLGGETPSVIEKAMEGLEQTSAMKDRIAKMQNLKS
jgi:hypothetical protein